jgi:hypothetical protein
MWEMVHSGRVRKEKFFTNSGLAVGLARNSKKKLHDITENDARQRE